MLLLPGADLSLKPEFGAELDWDHELAQGLQACWLLNETPGGILTDLAGRARGVPNNAPPLAVSPFGAGFLFNGTSQSYSLLAPSNIGASLSYSAEVWFRWGATNVADSRLWGEGNTATANTIVAIVSDNTTGTHLRLQHRDDAGGGPDVAGLTVLSGDTKLHQVVMTRSGNSYVLYLDGNVEASSTAATGTTSPNLETLGALDRGAGPASWWPGSLFLVRLWKSRTLSRADVQALYAAPFEMILPPAGWRYFSLSAAATDTVFPDSWQPSAPQPDRSPPQMVAY